MNQVVIQFITTILLCISLRQTQAEDGNLNKSPPLHISNGSSSIDIIIDRHIIHFMDTDPSSPLKKRIDNLQALLKTYFLDHPREPKYSFTFGLYSELNARMAALASCSQQWNFQAGRAQTKNTANWLRERLNKEQAYRELIPAFEAIGYQINIASMESINLCNSREIDWTNTLRSCQTSIPAKAELPCGALLTFSLNLTR